MEEGLEKVLCISKQSGCPLLSGKDAMLVGTEGLNAIKTHRQCY